MVVNLLNYKISFNKVGLELNSGEYFEITKGDYKGLVATLILNDLKGDVEFVEKTPKLKW